MAQRKPNIDKMASEWDFEGLVEALGYKTEKKPGENTFIKDMRVRDGATDALKMFGNDAVEPLINGLMSKNIDIRYYAAKLLGHYADQRSEEPLKRLSQKDKSVRVREAAASALSEIEKQQDDILKSMTFEDYYSPIALIVDAMLGICAHSPDVLLTPPSDIRSTAADSLSRGFNNAVLTNDAKTGYIITQGGENFTKVEQNVKKDLSLKMFEFMMINGMNNNLSVLHPEKERYEIRYFSEYLQDDIRVFWAVAILKDRSSYMFSKNWRRITF